MPIYNFSCNTCEAEWDAMVGTIQDPDAKRCPECGSTHIHRNWNCSLVDMVYTKIMSDEDKDNAEHVKRYYERPDVKAKIRSGEIEIKEAGPSEYRPRMDKRLH